MKKLLCIIVLAVSLIGCSEEEPKVIPQVNYQIDCHASQWQEQDGVINTRANLSLALFTPEKMEDWELVSCVVTFGNNGKITLKKDDFEIVSRIYVDSPSNQGSYWQYWFKSKPLGYPVEETNYIEYKLKYKVYGVWYETIFHHQNHGRTNPFFEP